MREFFRRHHFLMRRLHSLFGIIPVGGFLAFHLYENAVGAWRGADHYNAIVEAINSIPALPVIEILFIFIPLYFHALYGIYIAAQARHNVAEYSYGRNWAFFFQRLTGIITLFFVTYHIWHFRLKKLLGIMPSFDMVAQAFSVPWIAAMYIIGVTAAAYHLCNGIFTFLITWGITIGPKSQRVSSIVTNAAFVGLSALGIAAVFAFRA
ncbi:MAG TPA: succinate dehydrogenase cytochrome b558 subunit [Symbiobacteriaceae bacterium]